MKKNLLVIVLIFYSLSIIGQVDNSADGIFKEDLESFKKQEDEKFQIYSTYSRCHSVCKL